MHRSRIFSPLAFVIALAMLITGCAPAPQATPAPQPPSATQAPAAPAEQKPAATTAPAATAAPKPAATTAASPAAAAKPAAGQANVPQPPAQRPPMATIEYGIVSYNPFHLVMMVANEKQAELLEPFGIKVNLSLTRSVPAAIQALAGGSIHIVTVTPGGSLPIQEQNPDFKQFAQILTGNAYTIVGQKGVSSFADVKGQKVAGQSISQGADIETLRLVLQAEGLTYPEDYDILISGSVNERAAALMANQVAAIAMLPPQTFQLLDQGYTNLSEAAEYPFFKDVTTATLLAKEDWMRDNSDALVRFLQAYVYTTDWVYKNKDESVRIFAELTKTDRALAERTYDQFVSNQFYPYDIQIPEDKFTNNFENLKKLGQDVPEDPMSLVDNTYADQALK